MREGIAERTRAGAAGDSGVALDWVYGDSGVVAPRQMRELGQCREWAWGRVRFVVSPGAGGDSETLVARQVGVVAVQREVGENTEDTVLTRLIDSHDHRSANRGRHPTSFSGCIGINITMNAEYGSLSHAEATR